MTTLPTLPNTENYNIAALAVAWEIVKSTQDISNMNYANTDRLKEVTNAVIKAYTAIITQKPIEK